MANVVYRILCNGAPIELTAAKVNLGINRLWFFDEQSRLLAVFRWETILGLMVVGSAEGQIIAGVPDNMRDEKEKADESRTPPGLLARIEGIEQTLRKADSDMGLASLTLRYGSEGKAEVNLLLNEKRDVLRLSQARITDLARSLQKNIDQYLTGLKGLLE